MKTSWCFCFVVLTAATGCGDSSNKSAQPTNTATSGGSALTAPVDYLGAMGKAQQSAVKTIDTASLKQAIQMFQVDKGRLPKELNELVQEKYLPRIPETPFGTRLDYDPNTGEIKVVKQ
jgi:hypothetical protein